MRARSALLSAGGPDLEEGGGHARDHGEQDGGAEPAERRADQRGPDYQDGEEVGRHAATVASAPLIAPAPPPSPAGKWRRTATRAPDRPHLARTGQVPQFGGNGKSPPRFTKKQPLGPGVLARPANRLLS